MSSRFQFVADHQRRYGVKRLCTILGIARSSFYYWRRAAPERSARQAADARLAARIRHVHRDSGGTYGVPRVTAQLRDGGGQAVNHKRVARVMRAIGLAGVRLRRRHRTTVADPAAAKAPDLIGRDFTAPAVSPVYSTTARAVTWMVPAGWYARASAADRMRSPVGSTPLSRSQRAGSARSASSIAFTWSSVWVATCVDQKASASAKFPSTLTKDSTRSGYPWANDAAITPPTEWPTRWTRVFGALVSRVVRMYSTWASIVMPCGLTSASGP